jgi:predicted GIY-YIG superfamily endonuclease
MINLIKEDLNKLAGVYVFKYNITRKIYIGSSINLWKRFKEHLNNKSSNIYLQRAFKNMV